MLLPAAIGDAYGAGFEFAERSYIEAKNTLLQYEPHPKYPALYRKYTDDTQMALAIAERILDPAEWTPLRLADTFLEVFKRDPREGYSKRFYRLLQEVTSGKELLDSLDPRSTRNGAVMRAYPLGVYPDTEEILAKARLQAAVTHNTEEAITSAQAVALMTHFIYYQKGKLRELPAYLAEQQAIDWNYQWQAEVRVDAQETTQAVLSLLVNHEQSAQSLLKKAIDLGGDVDTVGSLVLAIGSLSEEIEPDLPAWMDADLENGEFGRDYLEKLDGRLQSAFPRA